MASRCKESENVFRINVLDCIKNALVDMLKYYLRQKNMSFEEFIDEHMADIKYLKSTGNLHPKEVDKLIVDDKAISGLTVDDLEVTLVRRLLDNLCPDLFMDGCKTLRDFLEKNQHDIYHLFKFNERCCQCSDDYKFPVTSQLLQEDQYKKMFKFSYAGKCAQCIDTEYIQLDYKIRCQIFGHFSPIFKAMQKFTVLHNIPDEHAYAGAIPNERYDVQQDIEESIMVFARFCGNEDQTRLALDDVQKRLCDDTLCIHCNNMLSEQIQRFQNLAVMDNQTFPEMGQKTIEQARNLRTTETKLTKETAGPSEPPPKNKQTPEIDDQPESDGSQRSTGSKKHLKPTTVADLTEDKQIIGFGPKNERSPVYTNKTPPHPSMSQTSTSDGGLPNRKDEKQQENSGQHISSAGESDDDDDGKPTYEKTSEQKGLMLILNFSESRGQSDVIQLRHFFKNTLQFTVESEFIPNKVDLFQVLENVINSYMSEDQAKQYYCFVCVVMSHGHKEQIKTKENQHISIDDIISHFQNIKIRDFMGKPKIFIVQICESSIESDNPPEVIVNKLSVLNDADILIAYATQGYNDFKTNNSDEGAWFIQALLKTIKDSYEVDHFEDMLVSVRHKIAEDLELDRIKNRQMPYSWTTLTKWFYLK